MTRKVKSCEKCKFKEIVAKYGDREAKIKCPLLEKFWIAILLYRNQVKNYKKFYDRIKNILPYYCAFYMEDEKK